MYLSTSENSHQRGTLGGMFVALTRFLLDDGDTPPHHFSVLGKQFLEARNTYQAEANPSR
jgi:hypothetical protein